jgi:2,3-bisphosphoglycerate-independent phosphoglycerate mutase
MSDYDRTINNKLVAFDDIEISNTLGEVLSKNDIRQLRTAETEKYAHVTFFFNGGKEEPYKGEDRVLIPSPKDVKTYDEKPQMSAYEVCNCVIDAIKDDIHKVIIVNFANPDMVGHTGNLDAAIKAIEAVDDCLSKIDKALVETKSTMLIIADHGNSEKMIDDNGAPWTAHTNNLVPFILVNYDDELKKTKLKSGGSLCDIAPTILEILHIEKPKEMSGNSLLV